MTNIRPVTFVAGGTRGDVQPYVLLARELGRHGITVQVAASARWQPLIEGMQVPYRQLPADPVELLLQPRLHGALTLTHGIRIGVRATWRYLREMRPYVAQVVREIPQLQRESRMIVAGVASQWIAVPAVWQTMPLVWGVFQPIAPTRDFATPMIQMNVPRQLNRMSHQLMNRLMWLSWQMHGLAADGGLAQIDTQSAFFAMSRQLVPPWSDMSTTHAITGWIGNDSSSLVLSEALQRFVDDATPFVVVTFGTPAANETTALYELVMQACKHIGVRVLIQVPDHLATMKVPDGVMVVGENLNHQMVFARAAAVVHHGGAGTTHACIAAGVPMLIVPGGIDQFYWARTVYRAGLMPCILDRTRVTASALSVALADVVHAPSYRMRMQIIREGELCTSGVTAAVDFIRRLL